MDKGDLKYLQDPYIVEALVSLMCQNLRLDEASRCVKASCRDVKNAAEGRLAYAKACLKVAMAGAFLGEGDISRKWIKRALQLRDTPSSDGIVSDGQDTLQQRKARRRPGDDSAKKLKVYFA